MYRGRAISKALARRLSTSAREVVSRIWRRAHSEAAQRELRVECEMLEERRMMSAVHMTPGSPPYFVIYYNYSFQVWEQGNCCEQGHYVQHGLNAMIRNDGAASESYISEYPVRYADGQPIVSATDISSDGFGETWAIPVHGQTRRGTTATAPISMGIIGRYLRCRR